jgi:uncharacterized protein
VPVEFATRTSKWIFRSMDKMRHRGALDAASMTPAKTSFTGFDKPRQIVLVTFKRSGEAMPSPIYHGVADGKIYVRTDATSGKVKRLRNDPRVMVVPCSLRGKPKGQPVSGVARLLPEHEHPHADGVIAANWSPLIKIFERGVVKVSAALHIPAAYIEITPAT